MLTEKPLLSADITRYAYRMRWTMRIGIAATVLSLTTPALASEPWEGIWAAQKDWCQYADEIGSRDPAPLQITSSRLFGLENACDITRVSKIDKLQAWIVDMTCTAEGQQYVDRELFSITQDKRLLRYTSDGFAIMMHRCSED
ncbi:MAG: hypothetical protein AAF354_13415 [Pseudomonadota bacterium]